MRTSSDLKRLAISKVCDGATFKQVAADLHLKPHTVGQWWKRHVQGESLEDKPRSGRPPTSNTPANQAEFKKIIKVDRRQGLRGIARKMGLPETVTRDIAKAVGFK